MTVATGSDGLVRCPWAATDRLLAHYHDTEWGVPVRDERGLYERVVLEGFQAGLRWRTVLAKRPAFRAAFSDFDPDAVAAYGDDDLEELMANRELIRNRAKIEAARTNARAAVALRAEGGLGRLVWSHRPGPSPAPRDASEMPTRSVASAALAAALRQRGFRFVGPTTTYATMQAAGLVDDHLVGCYRRDCAS